MHIIMANIHFMQEKGNTLLQFLKAAPCRAGRHLAARGGTLPRGEAPCHSFWQVIVSLTFTKSIFLTASSFLKKWLQQIALYLTLAKNCGKVPPPSPRQGASPPRSKVWIFLYIAVEICGRDCDEGFFVFGWCG